jgi:nucleoside-diphosphate-sugar epimerase
MKRVAVTGSGGFIGTALLKILRSKNYAVDALSRADADLSKPIQPTLFKNADVVVHLASKIDINGSLHNPVPVLQENFMSTMNVLEAIRLSGAKPLFIMTSTDRVYGRAKKRNVSEEERPFALEAYTASKIAAEALAELYGSLYEIPYIILRLDSVYGPGQPKSMFISDVIQKLLKNTEITTGPLSVKKNFVYVDDVCAAILAALRAKKAARNTVYNIGGPSVSLRQLARTIAATLAKRDGKKRAIVEGSTALRPSKIEVRPFVLSTTKGAHTLGWKPRTSIVKGIENTVEYFEQHG